MQARPDEAVGRRSAIAVLACNLVALPAWAAASSDSKTAPEKARGAAELDLEYYLRDVITGNAPNPTLPPKGKPKEARKLDAGLVKALHDLTIKQIAVASGSKAAAIEADVAGWVERVEPAFQQKMNFTSGDSTDQYQFDMMSYAMFKVAAEKIAASPKRDAFVRAVGAGTYDLLTAEIKQAGGPLPQVYDAAAPGTGGVLKALNGARLLLEQCKETQLIADYNLALEDFEEGDWDGDDSFTSVQLVLYDPATLGAFLQASGERQRFHADYVATALATYLRKCNMRAHYEQFPLDGVYKSDPNQFIATEVLVEFTLEPIIK